MKLTQGQRYDVSSLELTGWTSDSYVDDFGNYHDAEPTHDEQGNRLPGMDGYNVADYFGDAGEYKGPDCYGVEPTFAAAKLTVIAEWREDRGGEYVTTIGETVLWSDDGDNWMPDGAETKLPEEFDSVWITFAGGPRDGETVS